jgi:hypothetical protein
MKINFNGWRNIDLKKSIWYFKWKLNKKKYRYNIITTIHIKVIKITIKK